MSYFQKKYRNAGPDSCIVCRQAGRHALAAWQDHALLSGMPGYEVDSRKVSEFGDYEAGSAVLLRQWAQVQCF